MQTATGGPRSALTAAVVRALIEAPHVDITPGLDIVEIATGEVTDISADLVPRGSYVARQCYATIHGRCMLRVSRLVDWTAFYARPRLDMTDGTTTARFELGVYEMSRPQEVWGETPQTFDVYGQDRLARLRWAIGATYRVAAGTGALSAVSTLVSAAQELGTYTVQLDSSGDDIALATDYVWPIAPESTYRAAIGDLLGAVGYQGIWADWLGNYRSQPYQSPSVRASEWTYDADDPAVSIVRDGARSTASLDDVPNRWVFVRSDPGQDAPESGAGIYIVDNTDEGPVAQDALDGKLRTVVVAVEAETQAALQSRGDRRVEADRSVEEYVDVTTRLNPLHWHFDVVTLRRQGVDTKYLVTDWTMPFDGAAMTQRWRKITTSPGGSS